VYATMTSIKSLRWLLCLIMLAAAQVRAELPAEAVWIDVRTPAEFAQGHIEQATLIPFDGIEAGIAKLQLPKDTPIYLYCAVGGRAETAKQRLEALDYSAVTNVGGLQDAQQLIAADAP